MSGSAHGLQADPWPVKAQRPLLPGWDRPVWPCETTDGAPGEGWTAGGELAAARRHVPGQAGYSAIEPSLAMAKFAAEQPLAELLAGASGLRQSFTGRLLVPTPAHRPGPIRRCGWSPCARC
ncbi:hypothetical protein AB0469_26480 [Streptomyces sp. NPDC093801]|uniref:hypothetical protein n=1 Tax=Streptomyces sp. NPDC093801 TaxID=3155203 RepID=UPI00344CF1AE